MGLALGLGVLSACACNDAHPCRSLTVCGVQTAGMHQALPFQELILGSQVGGFILDQRALDAAFIHQEHHMVPAGGLGGTSGEQGAPAPFDPHALVLSALPGLTG